MTDDDKRKDIPDPYGEDDDVAEFDYGTPDDEDDKNPFDRSGDEYTEYVPEPESEGTSLADEALSDEGTTLRAENGNDLQARDFGVNPESQPEPEKTEQDAPEESGEMPDPYSGASKGEAVETGGDNAPDNPGPETEKKTEADKAPEPPGTMPGGAGDDVVPFETHKKMAAADAENDRPKTKPKKLNKKFLLSVIVSVFCITMVMTFLMPAKKAKPQNGEEEDAQKGHLMDYSLYANRVEKEEEDASVSGHYDDGKENGKTLSKRETQYDDKGNVIIPPVVKEEEKHPPYDPNKVAYSNNVSKGGSGNGLQIPDTRNDRLQGKQIAGIKGLTSTQQNYSTDYEQQVEKNVASTTRGSQAMNAGYQMPSKEEYMNNVLSAYSTAYGNATAGNNAYAAQNDQKGKNDFYNRGNKANAGNGTWLGLNTVWEGTIFEATLTSAINTDLPGEITARVAKNIYSSQDGRFLLIPQNSVLLGSYNSSISYSQSRVQVQWDTLIRPDGYKIDLGGMNGTDAQGASGIKGHINDHPFAYLKAILLMSSVSIANAELTNQMGKTQNQYVQNVLADTQKVANELGGKLIDRAMNVQPTITIKEGTKINIVVNKTFSLPPCDQIPVTQKYMRK